MENLQCHAKGRKYFSSWPPIERVVRVDRRCGDKNDIFIGNGPMLAFQVALRVHEVDGTGDFVDPVQVISIRLRYLGHYNR